MQYLSAEEILVLHALIIDETGGSHGVRDTHLLASVAHKPLARFGGKELYKNIFHKAAVLLEAITNYHVFLDGNKRTAFIAASRFLHMNGYNLIPDKKDAENKVLAVAKKRLGIEKLAEWLKASSRKIGKKKP